VISIPKAVNAARSGRWRGVAVVGWDGRPPTAEAASLLAEATMVLGGRRHLDALAHLLPTGVPTVTLGDVDAGVDELAAHLAAGGGPAVVLASGDPGFFGIVGTLRRRLDVRVAPVFHRGADADAGAVEDAVAGAGLDIDVEAGVDVGTDAYTGVEAYTGAYTGVDLTVLPGMSSVTLAFARAGLSWTAAVVVSAHGRRLARAVNVCRAHPLVAVLTGPGAGPAELGAALTGLPRRIFVGEDLGLPTERTWWWTPERAAEFAGWRDPNVVIVAADGVVAGERVAEGRAGDGGAAWDESASVGVGGGEAAARPEAVPWMFPRRGSPPAWAWDEDAFAHRDSMITKMEVRAVALARLGPGPGDLVWDVGAGSGSVAVECAAFGAAVVAVDRSADAVATVAANAGARRLAVQTVRGEAPAALAGLPDPDAVFVGGGGPQVTAACAARRPRVVVAAVAALDRVRPTWEALVAAGMDVDGTQLAASRLRPLPGGSLRLAAENPVTLIWGRRRDRL
jgi:precorrin-6Y C5,15-methyltransferase (decarboxylating)